jgi:phosphatidylglycerophosphate synthase
MTDAENRRPLKVRAAPWAVAFAARLAKARVTPDLISAASMAFAGLGGALLVISGIIPGAFRAVALVIAAACIQGRLMCNLLDGMVAVEYERGSSAGPIWNEFPDRISDAVLLVGAGYAAYGLGEILAEPLGWFAALLAVLTAYVRELGRGLDLPADFSGPMAKQHRMAALTVICLVSALEPLWHGKGEVTTAGLIFIVAGTIWTVARRVRNLAAGLRARGQS